MTLQSSSTIRGKERAPDSSQRPFYDPAPKPFNELDLPNVEGMKWVDCSAELDESLRGKRVFEIGLEGMDMSQLAGPRGGEVYGKTLREIIQTRSRVPINGALIIAFGVEESKEKEKCYFISNPSIPIEIFGTPDEAKAKGYDRIAHVMTIGPYKVNPGLFIPLLEGYPQQFFLYPDIHRVLQVSMFGNDIGSAVGVKLSGSDAASSQD